MEFSVNSQIYLLLVKSVFFLNRNNSIISPVRHVDFANKGKMKRKHLNGLLSNRFLETNIRNLKG